jgi:hypothetical protein
MKTNLIFLILLAFLINACNVGVNKDLGTGLKVTNSGLSLKESYLTMDSVKFNSNEFTIGKTVYFNFMGVEGFTLKDGKADLGASISITDEKGKEVMANPDLFPSTDQSGYDPKQLSELNLNLKVGDPLLSGSKYLWKSKIWDKNGKGTIEAELKFTVK